MPQIGGRELVVHYLARSLHTLGHQVRVIGPSGWRYHHKLRFGYPVHRYPLLSMRFPEPVRLFQLYLDNLFQGCDVIHAHTTYPTGYLAARLKRFKKIPLVITPHGADIHVIPELNHGLRLNPVFKSKIEYALKKADALTAISDSIAASLREAGAPEEKIVKIPNGVDVERFNKNSQKDIRKWLNLPYDAKLIVAVGNYHLRKGHEILVKAMPHVLTSEPNARLVIVGRGNTALEPLIKKHNLEGKVVLTGSIAFPINITEQTPSSANSTDWLAALYASGEAYVSAGIDEGSEGLSLALLEAMAAGLPIIATNISGNRDLIQDRKNGLLVPPSDSEQIANAILHILNNKSSRDQLGMRAQKLAEQYRWQKIAQQYIAIYQKTSQS